MEWKYERVEQQFEEIPVGRYRLRIATAEKAVSKTGNDMLVLTFDVSGYPNKIYYYIPFLFDKPDVTNRMLTAFFDAFGLNGDFNLTLWVGHAGGAQIKHDEEGRAKIQYFLQPAITEKLPAWVGKEKKPVLQAFDDGDDKLPF